MAAKVVGGVHMTTPATSFDAMAAKVVGGVHRTTPASSFDAMAAKVLPVSTPWRPNEGKRSVSQS
jgi:hypothetical protein